LAQLESFVSKVKSCIEGGTKDQSGSKKKEVLKLIDKYVKKESNKNATITTIKKLISLTEEKKSCFLCKQGVDKEQMILINATFKPDGIKV
jgi:hypothetical protein